MKTLGQVLRENREKRRFTPEHIAKKTTVPLSFIHLIEEEQYQELPALPLSQGYVLLIAGELEISEETALALFRRDVSSRLQPDDQPKKAPSRAFRTSLITPRLLSFLALGTTCLLGIFVVIWQWRSLSQPPSLEITTPKPYEQRTSPVTITGKTHPENSVTINTEVISLDPEGNFSTQLPLPPGERTLVIQATDNRGRTSEEVIFITVE